MKHAIKGRKLGRNSSHRKALMKNMTFALLQNEIIKTTLPKAKELRPFVEKVISLARNNNLANRRNAASILGNSILVEKLFTKIGPKAVSRNGGYTRILKCGFRAGDAAPMAIMELVDRELPSTNQ